MKNLEKVSREAKDTSNGVVPVPKGYENEVNILLKQLHVTSLAELIQEVQQAEEAIFTVYKKIQDQNQELEYLEAENKQNDRRLNSQVLMHINYCI